MKTIILLAITLALNSCNTLIGIGRDTKLGYNWTKQKIQESDNDGGGSSGGSGEDVAPIY